MSAGTTIPSCIVGRYGHSQYWSTMTDVAMYRHGGSWTGTLPGYWKVYLQPARRELLDFFGLSKHETDGVLAVVDDFGTLVPVETPV